MGWDAMGWYGMGWDGMRWDEMGWDGMRWDGIGSAFNGMGAIETRRWSNVITPTLPPPQPRSSSTHLRSSLNFRIEGGKPRTRMRSTPLRSAASTSSMN